MNDRDAVKKEGLFQGGDTTVTLTLDNDRKLECTVLTVFKAGKEKRDYIALMPKNDGKGEVYLYCYAVTEDGQPDIGNISDDEEYEIVSDAFDEILNEEEFKELQEGFEGNRDSD